MNKKKIIWRYLLHQAISKKKFQFQQKEIAHNFGYSLSTVFNALKAPREIAAIKVTSRFFIIENIEKLLYLSATHRRIAQDIIYSTRIEAPIASIEAQMPAYVIYGAYSAFVRDYDDSPADYGKVYVYIHEKHLDEMIARFPFKNGQPNLFVLKADDELTKISPNGATPIEQIFVDIWNTSDWYAKDFIQAIEEKIF